MYRHFVTFLAFSAFIVVQAQANDQAQSQRQVMGTVVTEEAQVQLPNTINLTQASQAQEEHTVPQRQTTDEEIISLVAQMEALKARIVNESMANLSEADKVKVIDQLKNMTSRSIELAEAVAEKRRELSNELGVEATTLGLGFKIFGVEAGGLRFGGSADVGFGIFVTDSLKVAGQKEYNVVPLAMVSPYADFSKSVKPDTQGYVGLFVFFATPSPLNGKRPAMLKDVDGTYVGVGAERNFQASGVERTRSQSLTVSTQVSNAATAPLSAHLVQIHIGTGLAELGVSSHGEVTRVKILDRAGQGLNLKDLLALPFTDVIGY